MAEKKVILENVSARLWIVDGIHIAPTAAVAVPESAAKLASVQAIIEDGELRVADEERPAQIVTTEEEAKAIQAAQKKAARNPGAK